MGLGRSISFRDQDRSSRNGFGNLEGNGLERSISVTEDMLTGQRELKKALLFVDGWRGRLKAAGEIVEREK